MYILLFSSSVHFLKCIYLPTTSICVYFLITGNSLTYISCLIVVSTILAHLTLIL